MTSRFIVCSAVLLTATMAGAQDCVTQELSAQQGAVTATTAERRATELMAQAQAGGRGGAAGYARVPLESKVVKGAPGTSAEVFTESTQVLADGNRIVRQTTGRVYRDSQGRTRREEDVEPGRVAGISISDPVAQVAYSLDAQSKTAWKTPVAAAQVLYEGGTFMLRATPADPAEVERRREVEAAMTALARKMPPPPPPAPTSAEPMTMTQRSPEWVEKAEVLPARNIEGVMAEGRRVTRTIPAGRIGNEQPIVSVTEEWRSPSCRCS